jgi:hypothetical protein
MLYCCILKVLGSNLYQDNGFPDWWFLLLSLCPTGQFLNQGMITFLPNSYQFTSHQSSYHSMLYSLDIGRVAKWTTKNKASNSEKEMYQHCQQGIQYVLPVADMMLTHLFAVSKASVISKGKEITVTGCRSPQDCETTRLPYFLDNWLTDAGEVVSLMRWPPFTSQEYSWYSFLLEAESTPGPYWLWKD